MTNNRDRLIALLLAILAITLLALPYWLAYTTTPSASTFTGILMNPEDTQTYFAKMMVGYLGHWQYAIPFTPEPHDPTLVGVFYVWLGQVARLTGQSITAVYHTARLIIQIILFVAIYGFVTAFVENGRSRTIAYTLALFASGLGWVLFILGQTYWLDTFPVDFKQPGAHTFFTALTYPHIILATALILFSVWGLWRLTQRPSWRLAVALGLGHLLLTIAYPFLIFLVALIAVLLYLHLLWQQRRIVWQTGWQIATTFFIPAPLLFYFAVVLQQNAVFAAWDAQAGTPAAPWPHYLLAFGPLLLLAGLYGWRRPRQQGQTAVLWLWLLAAALLLYSPLNAQRRFIQGVHIPLSILATLGFVDVVLPRLSRSRLWQALLHRPNYTQSSLSRFVAILFVLFMSLSNLYLLASVSLSAVREQPDPLFRPLDELTAVTWVQQEVPETAVFIAAYQSGNYIAGQTARRVMLGHWAETVAFPQKEAIVASFFAADTAISQRQQIIADYAIDYIWYGPREQAVGTFDPATLPNAQPVYQNDTIIIYAISR